jgi:hypothetical protein
MNAIKLNEIKDLAKDLFVKLRNTQANVSMLRNSIFLPFSKVTHNSRIQKEFLANKKSYTTQSSWGKTTIKGNILLQQHQDILEAIMSVGELDTSNNSFKFIFRRSDVLRKFGKNIKNYEWFNDKLNELITTAIELEKTVERDGKVYTGKMDFHILAGKSVIEETGEHMIELDKKYVKLFLSEISLDYKESLDELLKIESPLIRALVRLFLSHESHNSKFETALANVNPTLTTPRQISSALREIVANREVLESFGINITEKGFKYTGSTHDIGFISAVKSSIALDNEEVFDLVENVALTEAVKNKRLTKREDDPKA